MIHSVLGIMQARVSSSRLYGKVMMNIEGKPMLERQVERVLRSEKLDDLVVATGDDSENDLIEELCDSMRVRCFRGAPDDVLERFYECSILTHPRHVARITCDCPLIDPNIIDQVINFHLNGDFDYSSNVHPPTWPDGMDIEVMRFNSLVEAHKEALRPSEREHVTPFFYNNPNRYRIGNLAYHRDLSFHRLTVDEPEDLEKIRYIYKYLHPRNNNFDLSSIINLLEADDTLVELNQKFTRNEGFQQSLSRDLDAS